MDNILLRKEQCPNCAANGGDTSMDNLAVYSDGQTHCYSCNEHAFVDKNKAVVVKPASDTKKDWLTEYRGDFYSLPDRKLRAETLEKYKVKAEKDARGNIIKHHYPFHNKKGEMVGIKTRRVADKKFFGSGDTSKTNALFGQNLFRKGDKYVGLC